MADNMRQYSRFDQLLINIAQTLQPSRSALLRKQPGEVLAEAHLTKQEQRQVAGLMRVNHVGEVCAQALYQGHALVARTQAKRQLFIQAAEEEQEHLAWCEARIKAVSGRTSYLNPVWYVGALTLGMTAGLAGDDWSLGFIAETEQQVVQHLTSHLQRLPVADHKTRAVLETMRIDESRHEQTAHYEGAKPLPTVVKIVMRGLSKVMTTTAYWL